MRDFKACFVGMGSIAKRHIVNLHEVCLERGLQPQIDVVRRSGGVSDPVVAGYIHQVYTDIQAVPSDYDAVFITNPTEYHLDTLEVYHNKGRHFFIEKPLTSYRKLEDTFRIQYREDSVYYVACPLRYTAVLQYIKENIDLSTVISARCISSSYLPDWRPGIDYRTTYSANKELGGGVSIDLIHEWDYIKFLFGMPEKVFYTCGKKSGLELDCEDYAIYVADYPDKMVELHLDYFGRKTVREVMLFTTEDTIVGDLANSTITWLKQGKTIDFGQGRNDFQKKEMHHFLDMVEGKIASDNSIMDAYQTLNLTQGLI